MPAVSGTPTQINFSVSTIAELEGQDTSQNKTGDLATVQPQVGTFPIYYALVVDSVDPINSPLIIPTKNSAGGTAPGRWYRLAAIVPG